MELDGKVGLVTGGGTGVGRATVLGLARAGAAGLIVNYSRSAGEAEATAAEARALGAEAVAVQADVADESEVIRLVHGAAQHFGRLDLLVNNAATTRFIPHHDLEALTADVWDTILGTNLKGAFYCARAAAPELRKANGAIVNVASIAGLRGAGSSIPYAVSKAGLLQLTRALAVALAPDVTVNAVAPGLVATRWFKGTLGEEGTRALEEAQAAKTPLRQVVTPDHVAQAVLGLLRMDNVTGEVIVVDGGLHVTY